MAPRFVARQLAHPHGVFGRVIGYLMNRHNAQMNAFAVQMLAPDPADHVLEIGFGGGAALPALIRKAGFVAGVDRSRDAVAWAKARYARAVAAGHAEFHQGSVDALPFEDSAFDKACTVNTIYFWQSLASGCAEIHRVLRPAGRAAIGFLPRERMARMNMPDDIFTLRTPDEVTAALAAVGFKSIQAERPQPSTPWNVIVATR